TMVYDASPFSSNDPTSDEVIFLPFDLSNANNASLAFDIAHIKTAFCNTYIGLQVQASTDCGETFPFELYNKNDASTITTNCGGPNQCPCSQASPLPLQTVSGTYQASADNPWRPTICADWRNETIDLNALLGNESVILRFKANKATFRANNIYIDNVCLNLSYNPLNKPAIELNNERFAVFPNPSTGNFKLFGSAHLGETIQYRVVNSAGQLVQTGAITANDNQLKTDISMAEFSSGIYTLQLFSASRTQTLKIIHQKP
ncbi:MAG: T9SS type A sorting domain-containing protein, partial [Bacteroidia bacterium]